jgi:1,4-dihydroxy-2-naphthoyl-CoA hydrolase
MFVAYNKVRMHDTDMAGLLYFARQFRFANDALEDFFQSEGYTFDNIHDQNYAFVIVHAEADYLAPLRVGDKLEVHMHVEKIGNSSITFIYNIFKENQELIGTVKTVHVTIDRRSGQKASIPDEYRQKLSKYLMKSKGEM